MKGRPSTPVPRPHARLHVLVGVFMRILTRYILGEVTSHALIGTAIFTFVIYTRELGQILELVVRNSAPLPSAIELFFLIIPEALTITLPAAVLIALFWLLGCWPWGTAFISPRAPKRRWRNFRTS